MFKQFKPSQEPIEVTRGYGDALSGADAFFADVTQDTCISVRCEDTLFVLSQRRSAPEGHVQILKGDMSTIARGLAVMQAIMGWGHVQSLTTWVHDHEALAELTGYQRTALASALQAQGWALSIDGAVWTIARMEV